MLNRYTAQKLYRGFESLPLRSLKMGLLVGAALLGLAGCGGGGDSDKSAIVSTYSYAAAQTITLAPGGCTAIVGPVTVDGQGTMYYAVADVSGTDALTLDVLPHAVFYDETCGFTAAETLLDVSFVGSKTAHVPVVPGSFDLVGTCGNPAGDDCVFSLTWNATY